MSPELLLLAAESEGFPAPSTQSFVFPPLFSVDLFGQTFDFTKVHLLILVGTALIMALYLAAFSRPKLVPTGVQNFGESVLDFVADQIARPVMGRAEATKWIPYLVTLFSFIFLMNVYEIIPGAQFPVSSKFAIPVFLSLISYVCFNAVGIRRQGFGPYVKGIAIPPGVPLPLLLILTPIELLSTFVVRPFTLAVRLFANLFAGHLLLVIFALATTYFLEGSYRIVYSGASFLLSIVFVAFELFVSALQAYIFTILTAVYIAGAMEAEH